MLEISNDWWCLFKILTVNFGQNFEAEVWSRPWGWSLIEILRLNFDQLMIWLKSNYEEHLTLGSTVPLAMFVIILVLSSLLITPYFRGGLPGGRLRREKVDKDGRELPTKKKGGGELPTGGLLASGCTTAYIGIFIIMLGMSHSRDYAVSFNNVQNKLSSSSHLLSSSSSSKLAASLNTKYSWEKCARVEKKYIWNSFETATMLITTDVFECK